MTSISDAWAWAHHRTRVRQGNANEQDREVTRLMADSAVPWAEVEAAVRLADQAAKEKRL